jgi:hypothetical protein
MIAQAIEGLQMQGYALLYGLVIPERLERLQAVLDGVCL